MKDKENLPRFIVIVKESNYDSDSEFKKNMEKFTTPSDVWTVPTPSHKIFQYNPKKDRYEEMK